MDQKVRNQGEIIKMAGNNAIQFLRGTSAQRATHTETSLAGQPLFETDTNKLYIGDGVTTISNLRALTDDYLPRSGGTMTGNINMGSKDIEFRGSDPGDIVFRDENNTEIGRIYGGEALNIRSNNIRLNATEVTANCNIVSPSFVATDDPDAMTFSMVGTTEQVQMAGLNHTCPSAYLYVNSNSGNIPIMQFGKDGGGYSYMRLMNVPSLSTVYVPGGSSFNPQGTTINSARVYLTSNYGISMKASTSKCYANINTSGNVVQLYLSDNASQYPAYTVYRSNHTIQGYWYANGWKDYTWTFPDKSGTVALTSDIVTPTVTNNSDGTVSITFN